MTNNLNEDLERFKSLLGYDPSKGNQLAEAKVRKEAPGYRNYMGDRLNEAEPEDEEGEDTGFGDEEGGDEEGGENTDFDFGDEGSPEDEGGEEDTGFGDEEGGEEEVEDEFGTASEFSAADDLESEEEDVEEIDVTAIVKGSDEAKEMAQQAVSVGQENSSYLQALTDKLSNLEAQLSKMDTIASKIGKLESDIKTPEERLELRSLDSYPFNQRLSDYWEEKAKTDDRYRISTGENNEDGEQKEYVLNSKEVEDDYNEVEIKNSFNPQK